MLSIVKMAYQSYTQQIAIALYTTLLFVLISMPYAYQLTDKIFGKWEHTIDAHGVPTNFGLFVHAIIFFLLVLASMYVYPMIMKSSKSL